MENSSPTPYLKVLFGLESENGYFNEENQELNVNLFRIKKFKPYVKNTVISLSISGIKNPPNAEATSDFQIMTRT